MLLSNTNKQVSVGQCIYCRVLPTAEDPLSDVVEGQFLIDLEDRTVELSPGKGFVVPKGVMHRPRAPKRTVILMVEGAGIMPTGDA